ncbi:spore germination protein GerPC [Paenibacillus donghaensis]|uniref:Uncharacterized protein n=1 Tax=Paenibacillus donghaensis TaxID=414771 RepID=A0A2Z2K8W6_9BACL|nr:spore germination protein GerPC [Paenibacillus donghaensis]ASA21777.1 hypothetical protein B9T62_13955 [Paenibacillus donghaensis]
MHPYDIQQFFYALRAQTEKLQQVELLLREMRQDIDSLKQNSAVSSGPVNYHFEQLKIEKLEGTLNIGMTPGDGNPLEHATVNGQPVYQQEDPNERLVQQIQPRVISYLQQEVPQQFSRLGTEQAVAATPQHIQLVIQDLERQMAPRIREYLGQLPPVEERDQDEGAVVESIIRQIQADIDSAVMRHMELLRHR